jgi:hypothetical protein
VSLWVLFDIELLDDPPFVALSTADPAHPWRWMRIIQFAKRANEKGRVLRADGRPVTARDLALAHDRTTATEDAWQDLLTRCLDEGLLVEEDGALCVRDWRRWHRKPSDYPEATAERKARSRRGDPSRDVTPGHACHASEAEAEAEAEAPPYSPPAGGPAGAGTGLVLVPSPNGKRSWVNDVIATLAEHLPGDLCSKERQDIARIAETGKRVDATPERSMQAIRQYATEVAYEIQCPGCDIRYPRRVALERALRDIEANPLGPLPNPWDTDKRGGMSA